MSKPIKNTKAGFSGKFPPELGRCVVLFDLDGTLMDSETARINGWKRAIEEIKDLLACDVSTACSAYQAIYNCHVEIMGQVGPRGHVFEDVRQEWNTRISYALLIALTHNARFPGRAGTNVRQCTDLLRDLLNNTEDRNALFGEAEDIADPWNIRCLGPLEKALQAFWADDFSRYLFPGAKDTMRRLKQAGIECYIASEGHLPTQWRKISALGLDVVPKECEEPLVSPDCLLTTGQAAYPRREMRALEGLMQWYRGQAAAGRDAIGLLTDPRIPTEVVRELNLKIAAAERMANGVGRIRALFDRLARKFNVGASGQVQPVFYRRVLYAVNLRPGDPRQALTDFDLRWDPDHSFRLAMVGDRFESDIQPILALAEDTLNTKVLAVWVKQGKYGQKSPPQASKGFVTCHEVSEAATRYLLQPGEWQARTEPITRPGGLFPSAISPSPGTPNETLEGNVTELIVGVGAARNTDPTRQEPIRDKTSLQMRRRLVDKTLQMIVRDIMVSPSRGDVLSILSRLCKDRNKLFLYKHCAGYAAALVEIFVEVASGINGANDPEGRDEFERCFAVLLDLLDIKDMNWASAVVTVLSQSSAAKRRICTSHGLASRLRERLAQLMDQPAFAALEEATTLFVEAGAHIPDVDRPSHTTADQVSLGQETLPSETTPTSSTIVLGHPSPTGHAQQCVLLGQNPEGRDVLCRLGGGEARNVVCICGGVGCGKSNTLKVLIRGALTGETSGNPPFRSSVIVFHPEKPGPSDMVEAAVTSERKVMVFTPKSELQTIERLYKPYRNVVVKPLLFRLEQLPEDMLCSLLELPTAAAGGFRVVLQQEKLAGFTSVPGLISAIEQSSLEARQIGKVINSLQRIECMIAHQGEIPMHDEIESGDLAIIDCGQDHGADKSYRLSIWAAFLSGLRAAADTSRVEREWLLVFDEFHHAFAHMKGPWSRSLSETISSLMKLGRHARVSMVAASQSSSDFSGHDFTAEASVLLIHKVDTRFFKAPPGVLWELAARQPQGTFGSLKRGQAWYCSDGKTGIVQVRRLDNKAN